MAFINLRNHRKLLIVDGKIGFTGGMNIREGHMPSLYKDTGIQDMHFRLQGPVVAHLQEVFAEDWAFTTGEILDGEAWFPPLSPAGDLIARGIADGPDEDFEKLRTLLLGALACAQSSVRIMTPYFLPDQPLITSLNIAALRGVKVEIMLPAHCNLKVVQWASRALLPQLLQRGCRIFFTPPPFDHSKLMVVDEAWALIGSANWDPRSLRLNFEFNVEIYNKAFARSLHEFLGQKLARSHEITREELQQRPLAHQLRDGIAHLFSPYM
jgi:cardiolipin synthase